MLQAVDDARKALEARCNLTIPEGFLKVQLMQAARDNATRADAP